MALWTPEYIDTALWLDASDSDTITLVSGAVSQWADKSGNGRHAKEATTDMRPVHADEAVVFDGGDCLQFDGSNSTDYPLKFGTGSFAILAVVTPTVITRTAHIVFGARGYGIGWFFGLNNANPYMRMYNGAERWTPAPIAGYSVSASTLLLGATAPRNNNGVFRASGATVQTTTSVVGTQTMENARYVRVGSYSDESNNVVGGWLGKIHELLIFSGITQSADWEKSEGYLAHKWGLAAGLPTDHPYKTTAPAMASISGIITDRLGQPCQRKVYAMSRPTGAVAPVVIAHGLSDPTTGAYELVTLTEEEVTRVVVSEDDDPLLNDIVDRVIPA